MDFLPLSTQVIGLVGDSLGAGTQDVAGPYLTNLVTARMGQSEFGATALQRLREQPGDQNRRIAAARALASLAESDPQFAEQLFYAVEQAHQAQHAGAHQGSAHDPTSNVHNPTTHNRPGMIVLAIFGVIGALMLISFTLVQLFGDAGQSRAEDVAVQFGRAAVLNDIDTACALLASNALIDRGECFSDDRPSPPTPEERRQADSVRVVSSQLTSDTTARVRIRVDGEEEEGVIHLTQEDGQWKVFSTS